MSDDLLRLATAAGWDCTLTRGGHYRMTPPEGTIDPRTGEPARPVFIASTPSDRRAWKNNAARLRRLGLKVPRK